MDSPQGINWKKRLRPKAYAIGVYAVAFFILVELAVLGSAFWMRQRVVLETEGPVLAAPAPVEAVDNGAAYSLPAPSFEARLNPAQGPSVPERVARLNEEATNFRRSGSFPLAQAALDQALEIEPDNPLTLTNYAMLEEARGNNTRALELWRQIIRMGDKARDTIQLARERSVILEERLRLEEENKRRDDAAARPRRVAIERVITRPEPVPSTPQEIERDFVFKVDSAAGALQGSKIRIQAYVYERIGNDRLTTVPIEARFLNDPPAWTPGNEEILRVRYQSNPQRENHRYYGYLVRIYYDGVLQDERVEPATLLRLSVSR